MADSIFEEVELPADTSGQPPFEEVELPGGFEEVQIPAVNRGADIEKIAARVSGIDNPVEMLRTVATDPELQRDTTPEARDLWRKSAESEILPQLQKSLGITDEAEARKKLYEDPGVFDYGAELMRSFVPASKETFLAQGSGITRILGNNTINPAAEMVRKQYGLKDDAAVLEKISELGKQLDEETAQRPKRGFFGKLLDTALNPGGQGGLLGIQEGDIDLRDTKEQSVIRRAQHGLRNREVATELDKIRESVKKETPDDPRIQGTNVGAFVEGIAQTPANLLGALAGGGPNLAANFGQLYDEAYKQGKERGMNEGDADRAAKIAATINLPIETVADYVLLGIMPKAMKDKVTAFSKASPKTALLAKIYGKAYSEAMTEAVQTNVTNLATGSAPLQGITQAAIGGAGGGFAAGVLDVPEAVRDEVRRIAVSKAAAVGPATAAAVTANPAVADALANLEPSRNYAEEQRRQLAAQTNEPQTTPETEATTAPVSAPAEPASAPREETPDPVPEDITYAEWETGGGIPSEQERESGDVEFPAPAPVETDGIEGVPVERVASAAIASRPDVMQFKRMDDTGTGVNEAERLDGGWDDLKAGVLLVWEPSDPAAYGLGKGQRYIVANGHHRKEFGDRQGVAGFNVQVLREEDGYSSSDARRIGAEINIADNKGTIYDQSKYLRDTAATLGKDEALAAGARIGARGRKAAAIAFNASDSLYEAFVNERVSPEHAEAIASAVPGDDGPQRVGLRAALNGQHPQMAANLARAAMVYQGGQAKTQDLFGADDEAMAAMEAQARKATEMQRGIREQVTAVQGAARRPEVAARLGVNVTDPEGVAKRIAELKADLARWSSWPMHPDLVAVTRGQDPTVTPAKVPARGPAPEMFTGAADDPFNLVSETAADMKARQAREAAEAAAKAAEEEAAAKALFEKQQGSFFTSPEVLQGPWSVGAVQVINGRSWKIIADRGGFVEAEAMDRPGITRMFEKPDATANVERMVDSARAKLRDFFHNVGHPPQVFVGSADAAMYVGIEDNNIPRIYVNWSKLLAFTAGMSEAEAENRIYLGLSEEIVHVAEIRYQQQNPLVTAEFVKWATDPTAVGHNPSFAVFLRKTYAGFDQLAPYQQAAEAARVIIQKRWLGTVTESVIQYLRGLLDYLNKFVANLTTDNPPYVDAYIRGIEDVLFGRTAVNLADETTPENTLPTTPFAVSDFPALKAALAVEGFSLDSDESYFEATGSVQITDRLGASNRGTFAARPRKHNLSASDILTQVRAKRDAFIRADKIGTGDQRINDLLQRLAEGDDFPMDELDDWKRWRYGNPPTGRKGENRGQRFFTPAAFEAAFDAAFSAKDFDAVVDMVKAASAAIYGPVLKRLFREQATDPVAAAKAEWLRSVFNGVRPADARPASAPPPPQPTGATPPPRTPPPRQGAQQQGGPQQQGFPGMGTPPPPPAPPPPPSGKVPFNIPALVYVCQRLGQLPSINRLLRRARGRFVSMQNGVRVELHPEIFKNPEQAARTLAHEIGHFFDFIPVSLRNASLTAKIAPLRNWRAVFGPLWDWSGHRISAINLMLRDEAIALSKAWRGDFAPTDRYRNSADELYADFVSALLNNPTWTFQVAPRLSAAFLAGLQAKPEVETAYNLVNDLLRSNILLEVLQLEQAQAGRDAVQSLLERSIARARELVSLRRAWVAVYGGFINRFGPTMQKAGGYWHQVRARMNNFGSDYVSEQETAATFSERHKYLMMDQLQAGTYNPLAVAGISTDDLNSFLLNRRIIRERTATAIYLQQDPDEARELFKWMATTAGITSQWIDDVDNTPDDGLYELGARLVWAIHEAQAFDAVYRAAQSSSAPDFAERGLFAFDVSGFQLNPQGLDPISAQQQLDMIRGRLGPNQWQILEASAQNYYEVMKGIMIEANRLGLIRPNTWAERVAPNLNNYVPFMVIDYFTGHVSANLGPQRRGTAKQVLPVHLAGQLKAGAMLARMQRQRQALLTQSFFRTEGAQYGFANEMTIHERPLTEQQQQEIREEGQGLIGFYDQGRWRWMQFEDGAAVQAMESFDPQDLASLMNIGRSQSMFWKLLFTTYSVAFTLTNTLRTVRSAFKAHGTRNLVNMARAYPEALVYARAAVYGEQLTPELTRLVESGAIPPPTRSLAGQGSPDLLQRQILAGIVSAENMINGTPHQYSEAIQRFLRLPLGWLFDRIAYLSGIVESAPKIATERTVREQGGSPQEAAAFARLEGIPNPGISGKYNSPMELVLMFARVHIQGLRAFRTRAINPRTRGGFMVRTVLTEAVWKSFYVAMAAGAIDRLMNAIGGDDEEDQVDWQELVKRTTPYKLEMDDMIYLGWVTPDKGYELPFGHSSIPKDWTPLAIRIPHSEDGRYVSPIAHTLISNIFGSDIRPVDSTQRSIQIAQGLVPGMNPGFDLVSAAWAIDNDSPPQDDYKGQPIVTEDEWKSGYTGRIWGLTKHFAKTVGVPGFQHTLKNPDLNWFWTTVRETPGLGRLVTLDNYSGVREERRQQREDDRVASTARAMRGKETISAMRRMKSLELKGSPDVEEPKKTARNEKEQAEYLRLREWYHEYYDGTADAPGLYHTLKAKAAGQDVDADYAREALERSAVDAIKEAREAER